MYEYDNIRIWDYNHIVHAIRQDTNRIGLYTTTFGIFTCVYVLYTPSCIPVLTASVAGKNRRAGKRPSDESEL